MFQVITLGEADLVDSREGVRLDSIISQPKRLALLVFLTVESAHRPISRDHILGTFWPEIDTNRGSKALSQALYFLRCSIPGDWLESAGGERYRVNPSVVDCDSVKFSAAVAGRDYATALDLYKGEFLRGFRCEEGDFAVWASAKAETLRREARAIALEGVIAERMRKNLYEAASMAAFASSLDPLDEEVARERLRLLGEMGQFADVVKLYNDLSAALQLEFGSPPSTETQALVESITAGAPLLTVVPPSPEPSVTADHGLRAPQSRPGRKILGIVGSSVATVALGLAFFTLGGPRFRSAAPPTMSPSVRVILESSATDSLDPAARTIEAELLSELARTRSSGLSAHTSSLADPSLMKRPETVYVARMLLSRQDSLIRIAMIFLNGYTGEVIDRTIVESLSRLPMESEETVLRLADFIRAASGKAQKRERIATAAGNASPRLLQAHQDRIVADSLRSSGAVAASAPRFASADSALHELLLENPKLRDLVMIELAELHLAKAWLHFFPPDASFDKYAGEVLLAHRFADSAVISRPSAPSFEMRGVTGYYLWLVGQKGEAASNKERALSDLRRAVALAPARARAWSVLSTTYFADGQFADARMAAERAYAADAFIEEAPQVLQQLFFASLETSDVNAAASWLREIKRRYPDDWLPIYCELELMAWQDIEPTTLTRAEQLVVNYSNSPNAISEIAARMRMVVGVIAAKTGNIAKAKAYQNRVLEQAQQSTREELLPLRAWMWSVAENPDSAGLILSHYVNRDPTRRIGVARSARYAR